MKLFKNKRTTWLKYGKLEDFKLIYWWPFCELTVRDTEKTINKILSIIKFDNVMTLSFQFDLQLSS